MRKRRFIKKRDLNKDCAKIDTTTVGGRIKYWRKYAGINQEELAEKMFTSKQMISSYETNKVDVKASVLSDIANVLGIDVGWMFADQFEKIVGNFKNEDIMRLDDKELFAIYHSLSADLQSVAVKQMRMLLAFYERQKKH